MPNKTLIATSKYRFQTWVDRVEIPNHIPNEQIPKYRALIKQRQCIEGKKKKKLKYAKERKKKKEKEIGINRRNNISDN